MQMLFRFSRGALVAFLVACSLTACSSAPTPAPDPISYGISPRATKTPRPKKPAPAKKPAAPTSPKSKKEVPPVLNFTMKNLRGEDVDLSRYAGKVVLIVNTASNCGFTPQYEGLQKLHEKYAKNGLAILGFPANDFGAQEPGSNAEIGAFCQANYGVTFDMFSKVSVYGEGKAPLFQFLTEEKTNPQFSGEIGWNFEKFLIGRDGKIIGRFKSGVAPQSEEMVSAIESALQAK